MGDQCPESIPLALKREAILEEYKTLREETLKCIEFRYQIFNLTLIAAGALLTTALTENAPRAVLLLYPILSFFLASAFVYNSMLLVEIGSYIRDILENEVEELCWAGHFDQHRKGIKLFEVTGTYGLFLGTQIASLLVYFTLGPPVARVDQFLLAFSLCATVLTFYTLVHPELYYPRQESTKSGDKPLREVKPHN